MRVPWSAPSTVAVYVLLALALASSVFLVREQRRRELLALPYDDDPRRANLVPLIEDVRAAAYETFDAAHCAVVEQCAAAGARRLVRFGLRVENRGLAPVVLGAPEAAPERFVWSPCHGHYHFEGFSRYLVLDANSTELAYGHKQAYCLMDSASNAHAAPAGAVPALTRYTCAAQGINAGWADVYGAQLDCQWVDVTGLAPGRYQLVARINEARTLAESDYGDNEARAWIEIS